MKTSKWENAKVGYIIKESLIFFSLSIFEGKEKFDTCISTS